MPRSLGPFDKRRRAFRCTICTSLHLKCNGKVPCQNCQRSGQVCVSAPIAPLVIQLSDAILKRRPQPPIPLIHLSTMACQTEMCISHVFDSFLQKHDFTARPSDSQQGLKSCIQVSASARNAIIAVGALDLARHNKHHYLAMALAHYKQAVSSLRSRLASAAQVDDSTLWTSLLLAYFELMFDDSGTGFMLHFTRGLPALLRNQRIDHDRVDKCRFLLHSMQMLEVMRAASFWTYTQPTMLEDPDWQQLMEEISADSVEAASFTLLYALMGRLLTLNNLVCPIVLEMSSDRLNAECGQQLAYAVAEGWKLHQELDEWCPQHWKDSDASAPISIISTIYHVTLTINLASIFNFPHFKRFNLVVPTSSVDHLESQVDTLINLLERALRTTNLAGLLLLWPIRAAGAKAVRNDQLDSALTLLHEVENRGFAVARSFEQALLRQSKLRTLR